MEQGYVASIVGWCVWHLPELKVSLTRAGATAASCTSEFPLEEVDAVPVVATGSCDCHVPRIAGVDFGGGVERSMRSSANWSGRMPLYRPLCTEDTVTPLTAKDSPTSRIV
jgi:hypothetical protein